MISCRKIDHMPRMASRRMLRYREFMKPIYGTTLVAGKLQVYHGFKPCLGRSTLVRRHLGDKAARFQERLADLQCIRELI